MPRYKQKANPRKIPFSPRRWRLYLLPLLPLILIWADKAVAQSLVSHRFGDIQTIWLLIAAALVFFMNAGFAMLETGFCRTENAINVLAKNLIVFCIATVAFWLFGFRYMFGDSDHSVWGQIGLLLNLPFPAANAPNPFPSGFTELANLWQTRSFAALFFFQLAFAGTAGTIVSGAVAERVKFWAFILFSFVLVGFIYPFTGYWVWGGGWLSAAPFHFRDFAGSTVVHSVGGVAALTGAWLLKPRKGKFGYSPEEDGFAAAGDTETFTAYNLGLATLGCFILWLGWFGFNGGSTTRLEYVPHIIATTLFAGAVGGVSVVLFSPFLTGQKVSLSAIINGILGGLVGITASSGYVDIESAGIIGALSGILVLLGDRLLKWLKLDDPVGAVPVHLLCGGWGTIAVGIFASQASLEYDPGQMAEYSRFAQIFYQLLGWVTVVVVAGILSTIAWLLIGLLLHYLDSQTQRLTWQKKPLSAEFDQAHGFLGTFYQLLQTGRQGIRVSLEKEEEGSDETIVP